MMKTLVPDRVQAVADAAAALWLLLDSMSVIASAPDAIPRNEKVVNS